MSIDAAEIMACWPKLLGTAKRILPRCDRAVWEDVASTSVEKALRAGGTFTDSRKLSSWLCQIARNTAIDLIRATHTINLQPETADSVRARIDAGSDRQDDGIDMTAAVAVLPADLLTFARLRLHGYGPVTAGAELGWPRSVAWRRELKLRQHLRANLGEEA